MMDPFLPAGELLGPDCGVRSVVLADAPHLPDGEYTFVDTYCTDSACDCRKTIILGRLARPVSPRPVQGPQEHPPVVVTKYNRLPPVPPGQDVIHCTRKLDSRATWHEVR